VETVIVIASVTLKLLGVIVTCALTKRVVKNNNINSRFFFIAFYLIKGLSFY